MSNKLFPSQVRGIVREGKLIGCTFSPQGTGTPVINAGNGIKSVVWNSTGNFTVTFQNQFRALVAAVSSVQLAVAAARFAQITSINVTGGGSGPQTCVIQVQDNAGNPEDIAAAGGTVTLLVYAKSAGVSYAAGKVE